jgi:hypothetical protein
VKREEYLADCGPSGGIFYFSRIFLSTFWWPGTAIKEKGKVKSKKGKMRRGREGWCLFEKVREICC